MSEVKRYRLDPESCAAEHPQGDLVDYHEYARLKAEVERLRKAGDAMQKRLIFIHDRWDSDEPNIESDAWNAAKEGKPSV